MPRNVNPVANRLLQLAKVARKPVDPLQMQKLVYLAQGWSLGTTGNPLFWDAIEAWKHGPVVPSLYHALKIYGDRPIRGYLLEYDFDTGEPAVAVGRFDDVEEEVIHRVWERYGDKSGPALIRETHRTGAPWDTVRMQNRGLNDARIPQSLMEEWFEAEADKASLMNSDG